MQWNFSCAALNRKNRFDFVEGTKVSATSASVDHASVVFRGIGNESSDPA
jgi:hypothetical protein